MIPNNPRFTCARLWQADRMLTLILMRHAKSSWGSPELTDHDRPLNGRGRKSAKAMGRWLRKRGHAPEQVLCSSSRRTMETFEKLAIDAPISFTRKLYHAGPAAMLEVLQEAEAPTVLMLGHNPGIAAFARNLVSRPPDHARFDDYPTCATLIARFHRSKWADVGWGDGETIDFAIPRELT